MENYCNSNRMTQKLVIIFRYVLPNNFKFNLESNRLSYKELLGQLMVLKKLLLNPVAQKQFSKLQHTFF